MITILLFLLIAWVLQKTIHFEQTVIQKADVLFDLKLDKFGYYGAFVLFSLIILFLERL